MPRPLRRGAATPTSGGSGSRRSISPPTSALSASNRAIAAHDAHRDPRTSEFSESYLRPNSISSMLDAPIWLEGKMVGVVCNEHVGPSRVWTPEEERFAASVADFASLTLEAHQRFRAEQDLRKRPRRARDAGRAENGAARANERRLPGGNRRAAARPGSPRGAAALRGRPRRLFEDALDRERLGKRASRRLETSASSLPRPLAFTSARTSTTRTKDCR